MASDFSLKDFINEIKITKFSTQFIIPREWLKNILTNESKDDKNINSIKNSVFLNTKKNRLKKNLNLENIVIIVYEIMENIIYLEYDIDYLILINYDSKNNAYDFDDIDIIYPNQFNQLNPNYEQLKLDKGYFEPTNEKNKIELSESTNALLNAKDEDKDDNKKVKNTRRTKSGQIRNIKNIDENIENNILKGKKNNLKGSDSKNELKNTEEENENEENTDELHSGEKIHNVSYNFQKKKQNINNDIILINKKNIIKKKEKEKEKEEEEENQNDINQINEIPKEEINKEQIEINQEYTIYFYTPNQMIINLNNFKGETLKPVGLINPSIYCFMICILQSLISIPELNFFFLSKIYLLSNNKNKSEEDYPICSSYQFFVKLYLLSKKNYIQINRNLFRICNKLLGGMHMHDSQEFFVCFLEAMQDELNSSNKDKKDQKNKKNENPIKMEEKWNEYRLKNNSFIDSMFTGLMRSTVECKSCKHRSITYDPFIDLNVSLNKYKNLEKCLKQYFENEKIDCEYKCDNCKQISKVSKIFIYKR